MPLLWSQNHLEEHHLAHWIGAVTSDENALLQAHQLVEEWEDICLSRDEVLHLKSLIKLGEIDLVYRYVDLQMNDRLSNSTERMRSALKIEKALRDYVHYPHKSDFRLEIGVRCIKQTLQNWFKSIGLQTVESVEALESNDLTTHVKRLIDTLLKEEGFKLKVTHKYFIEELLKRWEQEEDELDYLCRFCSCLEQLEQWQHCLEELSTTLIQIKQTSVSEIDPTRLRIQLQFFEEEIVSFHRYFGKCLSELIGPTLSDTQMAIVIGTFRRAFQKVNTTYAEVKNKLTKEPCDIHLCCTCHYAAAIDNFWPLQNRVIDLISTPAATASVEMAPSGSAILIFTCGGGKGHLSTALAMGQYARARYHVLVANTLEETLASSDVLKRLLLDFSQEKLYNHLLKNEEFEWLKLVTAIGPFFIMLQQESIERLIRIEIFKQNPDMIISCFPIMNAMFLNVAKELDLPVLFVTTDLDTAHFIRGMNNNSCDLDYPKYRMTLAYDDLQMRKIIERNIPANKIHVSGFPIRESFLKSLSAQEELEMRHKFGIPQTSALILIMMGGNASPSTEKYATILADCDDAEVEMIGGSRRDLHVLCLCGNQQLEMNSKMMKSISSLRPQSARMKIQAIGSTSEVAELMSLAAVLITKPGGCTTNEALAKNLPMIFHAPFALMDWEVFNMEFCIRLGLGFRFKMATHPLFFQDLQLRNKQKLLPLLVQAFARRRELRKTPHYLSTKEFKTEFLCLVDALLVTRADDDLKRS